MLSASWVIGQLLTIIHMKCLIINKQMDVQFNKHTETEYFASFQSFCSKFCESTKITHYYALDRWCSCGRSLCEIIEDVAVVNIEYKYFITVINRQFCCVIHQFTWRPEAVKIPSALYLCNLDPKSPWLGNKNEARRIHILLWAKLIWNIKYAFNDHFWHSFVIKRRIGGWLFLWIKFFSLGGWEGEILS